MPTVALLALLVSGPSTAEGDSLTCDRDYLAGKPDNAPALHGNLFRLFTPPQAESNFSKQAKQCLMPVSAAVSDGTGEPLLVDIRDKQRYDDGHVPGAINIPADLLDSKPFLKTRPFVIYSEGYRDFDLVRLCEKLRAAGVAGVKVMKTGIQGWRHTNNHPYNIDDHRISPKDIVAASYKPGWLLLYFSAKKRTTDAAAAISFEFSAESTEIRQETETAIERFIRTNGFEPRLLIVSDTGSGYTEIAEKLPAKFRPYSFFLKGGLAAYNQYIENALAMIRQKQLMAEQTTAGCRR